MAVRGEAKASALASLSSFVTTVMLMVLGILSSSVLATTTSDPFLVNRHESLQLREEVREAFSFTYDAYMDHAFPKDELNPLSCHGEDTLGSYALTLVDSLDTLAVMGNWTEFAKSTKWVGENLRNFGAINDTVSVFETNIRVLGGLLSAHVLSEDFKQRFSDICPHADTTKKGEGEGEYNRSAGLGSSSSGGSSEETKEEMELDGHEGVEDPFTNVAQQCRSGDLSELASYQGDLLEVALDLGNRLARAFEDPLRSENATKTGIPFGAVHMQTGVLREETEIASTAGATTLAIEFGVLSRLTGNPKFETLAKEAMTSIWEKRSKLTGLVGAHINITSGMWTHLDSGIGASVDSYYEYLLKGNVLLGIDEFGPMFHQAYHSVETNLRVGPWYVEVNMETGVLVWPLFNSLQAFWPGLQTSMASCAEDHKPFSSGKMNSKSQFRSIFYHQSMSRNIFLSKECGLAEFSDLSEHDLIHEGYGCENRSDVASHDLSKAIETHGAMFEVFRRHGATPEGYSLSHVEPQPGQTAYPLRPELIESTYYLYLATRDPAYLVVGRDIFAVLQNRCRTKTCGYASLDDVDSGVKRDHMESFFLAETLKYLYLLFDAGSKKIDEIGSHKVIDQFSHDYLFSTEGHIFPLTDQLGAFGMPTPPEESSDATTDYSQEEEGEGGSSCNDNDVIEGYCRPLHPIWNAPRYKRHLLPLDAQLGEEEDHSDHSKQDGPTGKYKKKGSRKDTEKKKKQKGSKSSSSGLSSVKTYDEEEYSPSLTSLFDGSQLMVGALEFQKLFKNVLSKMFSFEDEISMEALAPKQGKVGKGSTNKKETKKEVEVVWKKKKRIVSKGTCSKNANGAEDLKSLLNKALPRNVQ